MNGYDVLRWLRDSQTAHMWGVILSIVILIAIPFGHYLWG